MLTSMQKAGWDTADCSHWGKLLCFIALFCLIRSCKAVIVMKNQWGWASEGEDYTAWAIHGTIHPFIALGFPHTQSRKYCRACEGWMWVVGRGQKSWGNHSDWWCISFLHCSLCLDTSTFSWSYSAGLKLYKEGFILAMDRLCSGLFALRCGQCGFQGIHKRQCLIMKMWLYC